MNSREKILAAVKKNQPPPEALPSLNDMNAIRFENVLEQFKGVLEGIGGVLINIQNLQQVTAYVHNNFNEGHKYITSIEDLDGIEKLNTADIAHKLEDVEVAVIKGAFGVAENAAIWITASSFKIRALPFICQHLIICLDAKKIVPTMHEAYQQVEVAKEGYGVFLAGPSKTADIEQSLVIGAHGARSLVVYLIETAPSP